MRIVKIRVVCRECTQEGASEESIQQLFDLRCFSLSSNLEFVTIAELFEVLAMEMVRQQSVCTLVLITGVNMIYL